MKNWTLLIFLPRYRRRLLAALLFRSSNIRTDEYCAMHKQSLYRHLSFRAAPRILFAAVTPTSPVTLFLR